MGKASRAGRVHQGSLVWDLHWARAAGLVSAVTCYYSHLLRMAFNSFQPPPCPNFPKVSKLFSFAAWKDFSETKWQRAPQGLEQRRCRRISGNMTGLKMLMELTPLCYSCRCPSERQFHCSSLPRFGSQTRAFRLIHCSKKDKGDSSAFKRRQNWEKKEMNLWLSLPLPLHGSEALCKPPSQMRLVFLPSHSPMSYIALQPADGSRHVAHTCY